MCVRGEGRDSASCARLCDAREAESVRVARPVRVKTPEPRQRVGAAADGACRARAAATRIRDLEIECLTRTSAGDQDQTSPLWKLPDKGAFTADLSQALDRRRRRHRRALVQGSADRDAGRHAHRRRAAASRRARCRADQAAAIDARPGVAAHALVVAAPRLAARRGAAAAAAVARCARSRPCRCAATSRPGCAS